MRFSIEKWLYKAGWLASFRAPVAGATAHFSTISRHESSLIPRLRKTPSRRLPGRETQRNGLRHLQIESEVQGPPRRDRRHPPLEEGSVSGLPARSGTFQ